MANRPPLVRLPTELLSCIADACTPAGIVSLRKLGVMGRDLTNFLVNWERVRDSTAVAKLRTGQ
jgi:hypothetical protein